MLRNRIASPCLPGPERIVGLGFRYWTHGCQSGDILSWHRAWEFYCGLFGVFGGSEAATKLSRWVNALNRSRAREIEVFSGVSRGFSVDECIAVAMIAACQHNTCPAMRACAFALMESSGIENVVDEAQAFADTLMSLDQVLSAGSIMTIPALVSPANTYLH
jgi:hypothetical protein